MPRTSVPSARRPRNEPRDRFPASSRTSPEVLTVAAVPTCRQVMTTSSPPKVPPPAAVRVAAGAYGLRPTTSPKYSAPFGKPTLRASQASPAPCEHQPPFHPVSKGSSRRALPVPPVKDASGRGAGVGVSAAGLGDGPAPQAAKASPAARASPAAAASAPQRTRPRAPRAGGTGKLRGRRPRPAEHPPRCRPRRPRCGRGSPPPGECSLRSPARPSAGARSCSTSPPAAP